MTGGVEAARGHARGAAMRLVLDAASLHVGFVASLGGVPVRGAFGDVRAVLELPPVGLAGVRLTVEVLAASIATGLALRDRHLRGRSFLDVAHHPWITYVNQRVERDNGDLMLGGRLTLRGRTRAVRIRCTCTGAGARAGHERCLVLHASLELPCRAHGVGVPRGLDRLNPIFLVVGARVRVDATLTVPADLLLPALGPVPGR